MFSQISSWFLIRNGFSVSWIWSIWFLEIGSYDLVSFVSFLVSWVLVLWFPESWSFDFLSFSPLSFSEFRQHDFLTFDLSRYCASSILFLSFGSFNFQNLFTRIVWVWILRLLRFSPYDLFGFGPFNFLNFVCALISKMHLKCEVRQESKRLKNSSLF